MVDFAERNFGRPSTIESRNIHMPAKGTIVFGSYKERAPKPKPIEVMVEERAGELVNVFPNGIDFKQGQHIPF